MEGQSVWMLLQREMFEACQSINAIENCFAGRLLAVLTKHYLVVHVEGTARRLAIVWDCAEGPVEQEKFRLEVWRTENVPSSAFTLTADAEPSFAISGETKRFTPRAICRKLLDMLCAPPLEATQLRPE